MQGSAAPSERTLYEQPSSPLTTPEDEHIDGLALRSLDDIRSHASDDVVDPRLLAEARPSQERLDEGLARQFSDIVHHKDHPHHHHHQPHHEEETGDAEKSSNAKTDDSEEEEVIYVRFSTCLLHLTRRGLIISNSVIPRLRLKSTTLGILLIFPNGSNGPSPSQPACSPSSHVCSTHFYPPYIPLQSNRT